MQKEYKVEVWSDQVEENDSDLCFKIILLGDTNVGKSCLSRRASKDTFEDIYTPTVGFEFFSFFIKLVDQKIKIQIWDTCGQEEYRSLIQSFYRNSSLAIIVYSIDNKKSFTNTEIWINESKIKANPNLTFFLVGNKVDLEEKREVTKEMANDLCQKHNIKLFMETSAKTGLNAKNIFIEASKVLYEQHLKYKEILSRPLGHPSVDEGNQTKYLESLDITLKDNDDRVKKKKRKCCF